MPEDNEMTSCKNRMKNDHRPGLSDHKSKLLLESFQAEGGKNIWICTEGLYVIFMTKVWKYICRRILFYILSFINIVKYNKYKTA